MAKQVVMADTVTGELPPPVEDRLNATIATALGGSRTSEDGILGALWSGPQAVYTDSPSPRTIVGSISSTGDNVATRFDHLLNTAERAVLATTEPDDHCPVVPVVAKGYTPVYFYYLHNVNRRIYVRVGAREGEVSSLDDMVELVVPDPSDTMGTVTYVQALALTDDPGVLKITVLTRIAWHWFIGEVSVDQVTREVSMSADWRDLITFSPEGTVGGDQGYVTVSPAADGTLHFMAASHPTNANAPHDRNIYFGVIDPATGDVAGRGNFKTGEGLPIRRNALERAYTRQDNMGVRAFKIGGWRVPTLGICDWSTSPEIGEATYRILRPGADVDAGAVVEGTGYISSADRDEYDTTDLDVAVLVTGDDLTPAASGDVASKWNTSNQRSWRVFMGTSGVISLSVSPDGVASTTFTSDASLPAGTEGIRVQYDASAGSVTFSTTDDGETWTQLGSVITGTPTAIHAGTGSLQVGRLSGSAATWPGKYRRLTLLDGIDGEPVADVDFTRGWGDGDGSGDSMEDYQGNTWFLQPGVTIEARAWDSTDLGPTGAIVGYTEAIKYVGGVDVPAVDGLAYLAREDAGTWEVVRAVELSGGWDETVLLSDSTNKLFRPTTILGGGPFECAVSVVSSYGSDYTDYASDIRLI